MCCRILESRFRRFGDQGLRGKICGEVVRYQINKAGLGREEIFLIESCNLSIVGMDRKISLRGICLLFE